MVKGTDLMNRPVVTRDGGERIGKVEDLIIDQQGSEVLGLLVDEGGWFGGAQVVRWSAILTIGPDVLIIDSRSSVVKASQLPEMKDVLDRGNVLTGIQVSTTDGRDLGRIEAFYLDDKSGKIVGYELSGGIFGQKHSGRSFLPAPETFEAGKDVAFVAPEVADTMRDLVGALRGG